MFSAIRALQTLEANVLNRHKPAVSTFMDRLPALAFGLALIIFAAIGISSYTSTEELIEVQQRVTNTQEGLEKLNSLLASTVQAESATRGYLMSGDARYLEDRAIAVRRMDQTIEFLQQRLAAGAGQLRQIGVIKNLVAEKARLQADRIAERDSSGIQAALRAFQSGRGAELTAAITGLINTIKDAEKALLRERAAVARQDGHASVAMLLAGSLLSFLILGGAYFQLHREIGRRRASQMKLLHLNRLHAILSQTNQAIVRTRDRDALLPEVARIAAGHGLFQFAWLGLRSEENGQIKPVAFSGSGGERFEGLRIPAGAAASAICNDIHSEPSTEPWLEKAAAWGYRSAALFPIRIEEQAVGAFALYAAEPGIFDDTVADLLEEVTSDLAFALENMDKERQRKRAEEALREQAQIVDQVHDAVVSTDLDGFVTSWNKGAERLMGYSAPEAVARHISFLYPVEEQNFLQHEVIEPLQRKETHEAEVRMRKKSGEDFYAHLALSLRRDSENRPIGMIGYSMDVTRTKQSQEALRESEERFRQMAENIQEVFWLADSQSLQVLYLSPAYERVWRRSCESAYGKPAAIFQDWVHPDDREKGRRALENVGRGEPVSEELRIVWPDGTVRWVWDQAFPIRDKSGRVYRFAGIAQDITERKNAAMELQARVSQQRGVAELGQNALQSSDLAGLLHSAVRLVAAVLDVEYCKVLEFVPEREYFLMRAGVGWKPSAGQISVPADRDSQAGYTLVSNKPVIVNDLRTESRFRGPELLWEHGVISGISVIIGESQRPFGILGAHSARPRTFTGDDVHFLQAIANVLAAALERKQSEEKVRRLNSDLERRVAERTGELAVLNTELAERNREVERANHLKSQFLASMSHELRTPLNAIIGFSDLLARGKAGTLNEKQGRFVGHVRVAARHLLQLINDVLDLSKIEAGRIELIPERFQVADALGEVLSIINPLAISKSIEIETRIPGGVAVYADRIRLKQILFNLLSNAVKFTPEHGKVWIEMSQPGDGVLISVTDNGIGIPTEEQEAVFDEFHQAGAATGGVKEGTGLGLAITRRLVELHGGRIWLAGEPGGGTRFSFTLPAEAAASTAT